MKTLQHRILFGGLTLTLSCAASAQSSVQLSGSVGAGITYLNNQKGGSATQMTDDLINASLFQIRGTEDIGDGRKVLFRLESNVSLPNGNVGGNGAGGSKFWNRQSYVGISDPKFGSLTLGRQYEASTDRAIRTLDVNHIAGSSVQVTPLALFGVNRFAGNDTRADGSMKYYVELPGNVKFGASYAPDDSVSGKNYSAALAQAGPNYEIGAMYVHYDDPTRIAATGALPEYYLWAVGGYYVFGPVKTYLSYFDSALDATVARRPAQIDHIADVGVSWQLPDDRTRFTFAYYYDKGTNLDGVQGRDGAKQTFVASLDHMISKRTDLYLAVFQNRFSGGYRAETVNLAAFNRNPASSNVFGASAGIQHFF